MRNNGGTLNVALKHILDIQNSPIFIDKLQTRLQFEKISCGLYEIFLHKLEVFGSDMNIVDVEVVGKFFDEKLSHIERIQQAMDECNSDSTGILSPIDIDNSASQDLLQTISNPKTNINVIIQAIHIAEMADTDAWKFLIPLARNLGKEKLAQDFDRVLLQKQNHLQHVRIWMKELCLCKQEHNSKMNFDCELFS
jgi:hypothetical protein